MEVKKGGKQLKHVGLSFVLVLCLALCACKAEKEEEDASGVGIGQEQDAAVNLEDGEGNSGETGKGWQNRNCAGDSQKGERLYLGAVFRLGF